MHCCAAAPTGLHSWNEGSGNCKGCIVLHSAVRLHTFLRGAFVTNAVPKCQRLWRMTRALSRLASAFHRRLRPRSPIVGKQLIGNSSENRGFCCSHNVSPVSRDKGRCLRKEATDCPQLSCSGRAPSALPTSPKAELITSKAARALTMQNWMMNLGQHWQKASFIGSRWNKT